MSTIDPERAALQAKKIPELKALCKAAGIKNYSKLKKDELVKLLEEQGGSQAPGPPAGVTFILPTATSSSSLTPINGYGVSRSAGAPPPAILTDDSIHHPIVIPPAKDPEISKQGDMGNVADVGTFVECRSGVAQCIEPDGPFGIGGNQLRSIGVAAQNNGGDLAMYQGPLMDGPIGSILGGTVRGSRAPPLKWLAGPIPRTADGASGLTGGQGCLVEGGPSQGSGSVPHLDSMLSFRGGEVDLNAATPTKEKPKRKPTPKARPSSLLDSSMDPASSSSADAAATATPIPATKAPKKRKLAIKASVLPDDRDEEEQAGLAGVVEHPLLGTIGADLMAELMDLRGVDEVSGGSQTKKVKKAPIKPKAGKVSLGADLPDAEADTIGTGSQVAGEILGHAVHTLAGPSSGATLDAASSLVAEAKKDVPRKSKKVMVKVVGLGPTSIALAGPRSKPSARKSKALVTLKPAGQQMNLPGITNRSGSKVASSSKGMMRTASASIEGFGLPEGVINAPIDSRFNIQSRMTIPSLVASSSALLGPTINGGDLAGFQGSDYAAVASRRMATPFKGLQPSFAFPPKDAMPSQDHPRTSRRRQPMSGGETFGWQSQRDSGIAGLGAGAMIAPFMEHAYSRGHHEHRHEQQGNSDAKGLGSAQQMHSFGFGGGDRTEGSLLFQPGLATNAPFCADTTGDDDPDNRRGLRDSAVTGFDCGQQSHSFDHAGQVRSDGSPAFRTGQRHVSLPSIPGNAAGIVAYAQSIAYLEPSLEFAYWQMTMPNAGQACEKAVSMSWLERNFRLAAQKRSSPEFADSPSPNLYFKAISRDLFSKLKHPEQYATALRFIIAGIHTKNQNGQADVFDSQLIVTQADFVCDGIWKVTLDNGTAQLICGITGDMVVASSNGQDAECDAQQPEVWPDVRLDRLPEFVLRHDWAKYIRAARTDPGMRLSSFIKSKDDDKSYERGISRAFRARFSPDSLELAVGERFVLSNVHPNSISGEWLSVSSMAAVLNGIASDQLKTQEPHLNLYFDESQHLESVSFSIDEGGVSRPLHQAVALVTCKKGGLFCMRSTGQIIGNLDADGISERWQNILGCGFNGQGVDPKQMALQSARLWTGRDDEIDDGDESR